MPDRTVGQHPLQPEVIPRPAQRGHGRAVADERVVELPEMKEDRGALCFCPGPGRAVQVGQRGVDLAHALTRPAADAQHERQPYPRLRGLVG